MAAGLRAWGRAGPDRAAGPSQHQAGAGITGVAGGWGWGRHQARGATASTLTGCVSHTLAPSPQLSTPTL